MARLDPRSGGVDVFDVNDNPLARARMSSLMTSALLVQQRGVETIPHLTPRDARVRGSSRSCSARTRSASATCWP